MNLRQATFSDTTPSKKLDVVTFILHENGFPSGGAELSSESDALARIQIVPEGGSARPRAGAMVQVVGCLARGAPNDWILTNSTEPVVTTLTPAAAAEKHRPSRAWRPGPFIC